MNDLLQDRFEEWLRIQGLILISDRRVFSHMNPLDYPGYIRVKCPERQADPVDIFAIGVIRRPDDTRPLSQREVEQCVEYMQSALPAGSSSTI